MIQFTAQFVSKKLTPTIIEILEDMSSATPKNGKYLKDLLDRKPLQNYMKEQFKKEYFSPPQTVNRPFTEVGQEQYQDQLLEALAEYISLKVSLSGSVEQVREMLMPTEDKKYGENEDLTRQIRLLSYWMVRKFENNTAESLIGNTEQLQNGKVKVVYIDGKPVALTEEELKNFSDDQWSAMVEPGLLGKMIDGTSSQQTFSKSELLSDFQNTESEAMKDVLESAGLDVKHIGERDENGIITAQIEDVNHQKLTVKIDTNQKNFSSTKFEFTFTDDPIHKESFSLSQNDVEKKFIKNGERVPAAQVARDITNPEEGGPREKTTKARPIIPNAIPHIPGSSTLPSTRPATPQSAGMREKDSFEIPGPIGNSFSPSGRGISEFTVNRGVQRVKGRGVQRPQTISRIKKTGKALRPIQEPSSQRRQPQEQTQSTPRESKQQVANRQVINPTVTSSGPKKNKGNTLGKIIAAGSGATVAAGPAVAVGAYLMGSETATKTALTILHCFGISCLA